MMEEKIKDTALDSVLLGKKVETDDLFESLKMDELEELMKDEEGENNEIEDVFNVEMNENEIQTLNEIGNGYSSKVFQGIYKGKKKVAIKVFNDYSASKREKETLQFLNHPNVIKMFGFIKEGLFYTKLVLEKHDLDLKKHYEENKISKEDSFHFSFQCSKAISFLHDNLVLHGDIKPANFLVKRSSNQVVISDFGFSVKLTRFDQETFYNRGSYAYISPETILKKVGCLASDVYSFSIMLSFLLTKEIPYKNKNLGNRDLILQVAMHNLRPDIPMEIRNSSLGVLMMNCWKLDYLERPTMKNVMLYINNFCLEKF